MYNTKQKQLIYDYLKKNNSRQLTMNDIIEGVCGKDGFGKSTVYRQISKLVNDGELLRLRNKDGKGILYQYTGKDTKCNEHFHLKCVACGNFIHLDCEHLSSFSEHILKEHSFELDLKKSVLYGLCTGCREGRDIQGGNNENI